MVKDVEEKEEGEDKTRSVEKSGVRGMGNLLEKRDACIDFCDYNESQSSWHS